MLATAALALLLAACVTVPRGSAPPASAVPGSGSVAPSALASPASPSASPTVPDPSQLAAGSTPPSSAIPSRSAVPSIGYISLDGSQAYGQAIGAGIREAAATAGIQLVECDSGWTRAGVQACIDTLAAAGVHGVISFQPIADLAPELCRATGDAPTIGIVYDQGPCQVSLLQIDQAESGRLAGAELGRFAAERWDCDVKAYLSLGSDAEDPIGGARMEGFRSGYQEECPLPDDTRALSGAQYLATAQTQIAAVLDKVKGRPIVVAGVSDIAILGAMAAAAAAGRENHLWYAGQLAEPAIREVIACDDHMVASVAQFPERYGGIVVPALLDAIAGREVPPQLQAELELVTAANVRQLFPDTGACDE